MQPLRICCFLAVVSIASSAPAVDYFVDKDSIGGACSDAGQGDAPAAPWCSIGEANSRLGAGDTVTIRQGDYQETIEPASTGLPGQRIVYRATPGEVVTLSGVSIAVNLVGKSYVTVDGIDIELVDRYVTLDSSDHVEIANGVFDDHNVPEGWPGGIVFRNDSHHNHLHHCVVARSGYATADDDKGFVIDLGISSDPDDDTDHNLIEDNVFYYGGHHVMGISASNNVVRNNYFHNENWMDCTRAETGNLCGNRGMLFEYYATNVQYNVVEGNRFAFSGVPPDQITSTGLSLRTPHNIVRRNLFYHCDGAGMSISSSEGEWDPRDNHVYHNVYYHNGYPALAIVEDRNKTGLIVEHHPGGVEVVDQAIKNNIFHDNQLHAIFFYYVDAGLQVVEGNWEEAGDPGFADIVSPVDPFDPTVPDFHLMPDSDCIDAGVFLTRTTGTGSGVQIPVEDAGYFSDGREVVEADEIQLEGESQRVRIVSIDYAANVLTVEVPIAWTVGQGVSLPFEGTAPDVGAYEYEELESCATLGGICCGAGQVCAGGAYLSASDCPGRCCTGGGTCQDPPPTCQNQGFACCESCDLGTEQTVFDADCGAKVCCETCAVTAFVVNACVEAEDGELVVPMSTFDDPIASGGRYVAATSSNSGTASYRFEVTQAGVYVLMARVMTPGPDTAAHDSFFVGLDGEVAAGNDDCAYDVTDSTAFAWDQVRRRASGDPAEWNLDPGRHVFSFHGRETDVRLDAVALKPCPSSGSCPAADQMTCAVCGDGTCDPGENCGTCSDDCLLDGQVCCGNQAFDGVCCGDGDCGPGERCVGHLCVQDETTQPDGGDGGGGGDSTGSDGGGGGGPTGSCGCGRPGGASWGAWGILLLGLVSARWTRRFRSGR